MNTQEGLTIEKVKEVSEKDEFKKEGVVAFAFDEMDNSYLCIKVQEDGSETVVQFDGDDNSITEDLKVSYGQYIESLRAQLLSGKLVYEDELGLCQV